MKRRNILFFGGGVLALAGLGRATGLTLLDTADAALGAPKDAGSAITAESTADPALARASLSQAQPADHVLGDPDAPVTLVEYASMTCPHCATFHNEVLPRLKDAFIEPGRVKLVFRHYPLDQRALRASMLAECFEGKRFFSMLDILFDNQQRWARSDDPMSHFQKYAGLAGLDPDGLRRCMNDEATADSILQRQLKARRDADIRSTPSFLLDGETISGNPGFEALARKLREAGA
jgi:protein-disulfide isomerase